LLTLLKIYQAVQKDRSTDRSIHLPKFYEIVDLQKTSRQTIPQRNYLNGEKIRTNINTRSRIGMPIDGRFGADAGPDLTRDLRSHQDVDTRHLCTPWPEKKRPP